MSEGSGSNTKYSSSDAVVRAEGCDAHSNEGRMVDDKGFDAVAMSDGSEGKYTKLTYTITQTNNLSLKF